MAVAKQSVRNTRIRVHWGKATVFNFFSAEWVLQEECCYSARTFYYMCQQKASTKGSGRSFRSDGEYKVGQQMLTQDVQNVATLGSLCKKKTDDC